MIQPADLSIVETGVALRSGAFTSVALTQAHLDRIGSRDPTVRAFVQVATDDALDAAQAADSDLAGGRDLGPVDGIPFAVKDIVM